MEIAIIADDTRKELMIQFCIAYCGVLSKHNICATAKTASVLSDATGLHVETLLLGSHGGEQQITSRISCNEIDVLLYFRSSTPKTEFDEAEYNLLRMCDVHNIPFATLIPSTTAANARARDYKIRNHPRAKRAGRSKNSGKDKSVQFKDTENARGAYACAAVTAPSFDVRVPLFR